MQSTHCLLALLNAAHILTVLNQINVPVFLEFAPEVLGFVPVVLMICPR